MNSAYFQKKNSCSSQLLHKFMFAKPFDLNSSKLYNVQYARYAQSYQFADTRTPKNYENKKYDILKRKLYKLSQSDMCRKCIKLNFCVCF